MPLSTIDFWVPLSIEEDSSRKRASCILARGDTKEPEELPCNLVSETGNGWKRTAKHCSMVRLSLGHVFEPQHEG